MVKAEPWREQTELGLAAQGIEQVDRRPVLLFGDIEVIDQFEQVTDQAMNDLLGALIAACLIKASNGFDKVLHFGGI